MPGAGSTPRNRTRASVSARARPSSPGFRLSRLVAPDMRDTVNSQYNSFLYWRLPIPELDLSELECLGLTDVAAYKPKGGYGKLAPDRKPQSPDAPEGEDELLQFNSFNFWRAPVARISALDFDLI
ncbi:hypothetical protein lerEdw1_011151 [Lerista edwardsae]|nr:hypothetical protein lerEdw1_011151 [Lerista edwardsae]